MDEALKSSIVERVKKAKAASRLLALASRSQKDAALSAMANQLRQSRAGILHANAEDVKAARQGRLSEALIDRLTLTEKRFEEMIHSVEEVAKLADPIGEVIQSRKRPNGLEIRKVRVPLGVIGIIYESRPNVTSDCAALCLKSGNAVILRGGAESFRSNEAIALALRQGIRATQLPEDIVTTVPTDERAAIDILLRLDSYIDVIIPRGGEALIRKIAETSRIPVIKHAKGVCHIYVDAAADLSMAKRIAFNAKCQRPATCNAMETLLVHQDIAAVFLPAMVRQFQEAKVEVRGCPVTQKLVSGVKAATEEDWFAEYLDLILSIKVVSSLEEAVAHIGRYGSAHSDAIVTEDAASAQRFVQTVDSAAVYVNASTRFTDGYQFGLGAEIGISTDRLHARGPMGLEELTTYKYVVYGQGQLRE
ncbi:MAG: glutamate-5-semialdehyde dehydrogenase [Candidatus Omnitrophica bacterium]|nr:glutamate-5-semialdehyde dehydrogenase [Candidatus Omnitrophota bacterium]